MKTYKHFIDGERIYLRNVTESDATQEYVKWLNDPEVNQYLESRFAVQTIDSVRDYVRKLENDPDNVFLAIIVKNLNGEKDAHIGNIKIGPINRQHKFADVGIMIGDKSSWGKGYGTEAVKLATRYAFEKLGLHKLMAGCYADNIGSARIFLKSGYAQEGLRKEKFLCKGKYVDEIIFGIVSPTKS